MLTGQNEIGVQFVNQRNHSFSPAFIQMYEKYHEAGGSKVWKKSEIQGALNQVLDEIGFENHQSDEYRKLMIHLMVGSLYRDDRDFLDDYLYSSQEI